MSNERQSRTKENEKKSSRKDDTNTKTKYPPIDFVLEKLIIDPNIVFSTSKTLEKREYRMWRKGSWSKVM